MLNRRSLQTREKSAQGHTWLQIFHLCKEVLRTNAAEVTYELWEYKVTESVGIRHAAMQRAKIIFNMGKRST